MAGPDNSEVFLVDKVTCLDGADPPVVKDGHHETLAEIVQVLTQGQNIPAVTSGCVVHPTSFHSETKQRSYEKMLYKLVVTGRFSELGRTRIGLGRSGCTEM